MWNNNSRVQRDLKFYIPLCKLTCDLLVVYHFPLYVFLISTRLGKEGKASIVIIIKQLFRHSLASIGLQQKFSFFNTFQFLWNRFISSEVISPWWPLQRSIHDSTSSQLTGNVIIS